MWRDGDWIKQMNSGWLRILVTLLWLVTLVVYSAYPAWAKVFMLSVSLLVTALSVPLWYDDLMKAREERRRQKGLCPNCGYDLRETKDRCPECGAVPSKASK